jgi:hypothetical protein
MQFLGDLDGLTIMLTGFSVLFVPVCLGLLWSVYGGRWPKNSAIAPAFLVFVAIFSLMRAYRAYCPDADQPHIHKTGAVNPFKTYKYSTGKHSHHEGILECVGPCGQGVPLMEFNEHATALVAGRDPSVPLTVTYLGRKEQADIWNGYRIMVHPVVEIDDAATGERIFLRRHNPALAANHRPAGRWVGSHDHPCSVSDSREA